MGIFVWLIVTLDRVLWMEATLVVRCHACNISRIVEVELLNVTLELLAVVDAIHAKHDDAIRADLALDRITLQHTCSGESAILVKFDH